MTAKIKKLLSLMLVLVMVVGFVPVDAHAATDSVVVIAASDYQLSNSGTIMTNIMNHIKDDYGTAYGVLMGGDYDAGSVSTKASHIEAVDDTISGVFPEIADDNRIYIQGNHENYAGLKVDGTNLMDSTGAHDTDYYGVYVINHDNFPWSTSSNPAPSESLVKATANALGNYLDAKVAAGYEKPIFITSHLPLHATTRGDNKYAKLIFDELEAAGEAGLNIIFLVGHNHSGGYDQYLGNGSFYLPVGSSLTVVDGSSGSYTDDSISFTYMNYGYLGKISGSACTHQTMTAFEITGSQVTVKRYAADGVHKLKAAGVAVSGYNTDSSVIGTEGAVIELGEPEPSVTLTDNGVTVTSQGLTSLSATKLFGTESTSNYDTESYFAYASYDIVPEGYTEGKSATVTIALDEADGFDASKKVVVIDQEKGTQKSVAITDGVVTFTTNHFSTYDLAQKNLTGDVYELATSIEAGESYVIVGNDHPVALMDNSGSLGSQEVTIDGDVLTCEEELTQWTFSSASSGTITSDDGHKLGYSSSSWNLTGSGDCTFDIGTGSNSFSLRVIRASSGYNRYYFYYDGSSWAKNSGSSASYVRLYKLAEGGVTEPENPETPETPETPDTENEWVALPAGNTFVLDTDGVDAGAKYLIVAKSYAKALSAASGSNNAVDVTISGDTATADASYGWTFSTSGSNCQIQKDGTYLGRSSSSLAAGSASSTWTVTSSGSGQYTITQSGGSSNSWWGSSSSYYVRWSNSNGYFQASNYSTDPVRLYKYTGSGSAIGANYIRLSGETQQKYTVADAATLDTVLGKLTIQTSDDGVNAASKEISVTSDMVTWDVTFDSKTAGTYTGTVICEDKVLGTVTVTVTGAHEYETVTVEATCETDGSITTTCKICGDETVEVIPALGHNYECVETAATCGQDGAKVYTCANCEDTYSEVIPATGEHNYESVTVEATCTEAGSTTYTCSGCGDVYAEIIAATGHDYSSTVTAPTCDSEGYTTYTCGICGDSYTDNKVEALGHDYDCVITATCTEAGYEVYTCATCGHSYNGNAVAALGHNYESTVVAPGCVTEGYTTYVCATCGHTYTGDEVAALGHNYTAKTVEATCTEAGYTTYNCATCGHSYVGDEVAALGHDYESVVTDPTFEEEGYTTHTCKVCGDVKVDSFVPVLQHTYETVIVDATCENDGSITHTCVTCGYTYTEVLPALGHSYETVTTEATCTKDGSVVTTCSVCDDEQIEVIPATGHSYTTTVIDPTCTEAGYKTKTCACGDVVTVEIPATGHSYSSEYTAPTCTVAGGTTYTCACGDTYAEAEAALGHNYSAESTAPTCTESGYTTYTCSVCGDTYTADEVAALGHAYTGVVTEPTCTAEGYTTYTCGVCGDTYTGDKVAALDHDYAQVVTEPTCTAAGYTTYTCKVCDHTYTGNTVAAKGHSYTCVESDGYLVYTCDICGDSYSEKIENLTYTKVSSISADNRYVITLKSGSKYYALSHADNKISAVQVTYANNVITSEVTEDLIWTYADSKLSYEDEDTTYYLYAQPASGGWWWNWWSTPTLTISSSNSTTVSFSNSKLRMSNYYLRYSNGSVTLSGSSSTTYFFKEG